MTKSFTWYIHCAISLALMIIIGKIPAPEPMTQLGMTALGLFAGCIYGWCTTNFVWPSLIALILVGYTGAVTPTAAWGQVMTSPVVGLGMWLMISVGLLNNSGLTTFLANWSITRKVTIGKPWLLILFIFLAVIACSSIVGQIATALVFWPICWAICQEVGYKKGDTLPAYLTFSVILVATTACFIMPFQMAVISNFGFLVAGSNGAYDGSFNYAAYLCFTIIMQILYLIGWMLISKYVLRIDVSKLENYVPKTTKTEPLTTSQKISFGLFLLLFLLLMAPSFLPKGTMLQTLIGNLGAYGACILVVGIACMIHIDGKPLFDFSELVSQNLIWNVILMMGTALVIANIINSDASGVPVFLKQILAPLFSSMSPYMFVFCYMLIALILTNLINNVVVCAIMIPISWTLCMEFGLNPIALVVCFILFVDFAILLPSSSPVGGLLHSNGGWCVKGQIYRYGLIAVTMLFIISIIVGWPLSNVLF